MSVATWKRPRRPGGPAQYIEETPGVATSPKPTPPIYKPDDADGSGTTSEPILWDDREFIRLGVLRTRVISIPGNASYPLRRPLTLDILQGADASAIRPRQVELQSLLAGEGATIEAARDDFGRRFARLLRENRAVPPHARTPESERIARIIDAVVDRDRYEKENPLVQPMWGQVRKRLADGSIRVYWVIGPNELSDHEDVLRSRDVDPSLATIPVGRWFYGTARSYPDRIEWIERVEEVLDPHDPEARRALWESLPKVPADEPNCWPMRSS